MEVIKARQNAQKLRLGWFELREWDTSPRLQARTMHRFFRRAWVWPEEVWDALLEL